MKNQWITLEGRRYNIASMILINNISHTIGTGLKRVAVYLMPKSKRVLVETYSQWENRQTHACTGTQYHIADADEIAHLYDDTQDDRLLNLIPIGE